MLREVLFGVFLLQEVQCLVQQAYDKTKSLLSSNSESLGKLAEQLLEKEVLNYKDIVKVIGEMPFTKKHHQHHTELQDLWY